MGSIFGDAAITTRPRTKRQSAYLKTKRTNRGRNVQHEKELQLALCDWLRKQFPDVHFISDTGSGSFNSKYAKNIHNQQQSAKGLPDITIFAARQGYHGLLLELKPEGTQLKMQRDGRKMRIVRDARGRIIERDYKVRKKGDWKNLHIETQAKRITELREAGYCALFVIGIEHAKSTICRYFDVPYETNTQLF